MKKKKQRIDTSTKTSKELLRLEEKKASSLFLLNKDKIQAININEESEVLKKVKDFLPKLESSNKELFDSLQSDRSGEFANSINVENIDKDDKVIEMDFSFFDMDSSDEAEADKNKNSLITEVN